MSDCRFQQDSSLYNNVFALAVTGVSNDEGGGWDKIHGPHAVRISGRTYHKFLSSGRAGGLQYFMFQAEDAVVAHTDGCLDEEKLIPIYNSLRKMNPLCQEFNYIGSTIAERFPWTQNLDELVATLNVSTEAVDISSITSDNLTGERIIQVVRKGSEHSTTIHHSDCLFEPLSYPILFPYGEEGWGFGMARQGLKFQNYLAARMLMPEIDMTQDLGDDLSINKTNDDGSNTIISNSSTRGFYGHRDSDGFFYPSNRFQMFSRLGQTYLVDQVVVVCLVFQIMTSETC
jgi:hypothetical protein